MKSRNEVYSYWKRRWWFLSFCLELERRVATHTPAKILLPKYLCLYIYYHLPVLLLLLFLTLLRTVVNNNSTSIYIAAVQVDDHSNQVYKKNPWSEIMIRAGLWYQLKRWISYIISYNPLNSIAVALTTLILTIIQYWDLQWFKSILSFKFKTLGSF